MSRRPTRPDRLRPGFSLLEIVLVLFVLGALAAALTPSVREIIERGRRAAEARTLDELAATVTASFENTDLTNLNLAALPSTIGAADAPTIFSASTTAPYATTEPAAWFAKVGRLRGLTPQTGVAPDAQPELARIAFNSLGNPRLLFAAPDEPGRQRFLLVSLAARSEQLACPVTRQVPRGSTRCGSTTGKAARRPCPLCGRAGSPPRKRPPGTRAPADSRKSTGSSSAASCSRNTGSR
jgi:prepilin-type N-terminal cleavage/methylation domain-containing protein